MELLGRQIWTFVLCFGGALSASQFLPDMGSDSAERCSKFDCHKGTPFVDKSFCKELLVSLLGEVQAWIPTLSRSSPIGHMRAHAMHSLDVDILLTLSH